MSKMVIVCRWILGLIFVVFGLNGFFMFLPVPPLEDAAQQFMGALIATGYMLPFWKSIEVIGGGLLLWNRAVPFALAILAPITANIVFFHLFLDFQNIAISVILMVLQGALMWHHREAYKKLFA